MKKLLFTLTLVGALALGGNSAFAQAKKKPAAAPAEAPAAKPADKSAEKPKSDKPIPMYVHADEIDVAGKTFTSTHKDGTKSKHTVPATAEIKNGEKAATLADIKVGDYVSGLRKKTGEHDYEVVKITKFGPKAEKAAGDAKKPAAEGTKPAEAPKKK